MTSARANCVWSLFLKFSLMVAWDYSHVGSKRKKCLCVCVCECSVMSNSLWPMDYRPPGSSVHGVFKARIVEQISISSSRWSFHHRDWTHVSCFSCIGRWILYHWATWEALRDKGENTKMHRLLHKDAGCNHETVQVTWSSTKSAWKGITKGYG